MLTEEQIQSFKRDGFLNYGPVLTPEETADLREGLRRVMSGKSDAKPEANRNLLGEGSSQVVVQIVNIWEAEPAFRRHLSNEKIVRLAAQLMGADTVRVWHDQVQVKPSHIGGPTTWHQDHPYWPVIQPADLVSAWVAIDDATVENGCMWMVPGSHRWGPYNGGTIGTDPETYAPQPKDLSIVPEGEKIEMVACPVPAGGVVFHHCLTWHGAPPNYTSQGRPAIAVHYMPGWVRYEPEGRTHLVEKHIHVKPGEPLVGDHFPTVLEEGRILDVKSAPAKEDE
ncbi:MAG TPA: phytanoyl-CoA dioxygenase family protein [Armatimonadaceae bacterium]|jgi:ectoine hydroxylase-related dioxygenase (phytanoyl-CoA dioxygenase family)|nr:phytanoyl-CoA dioxygenase family protein [Armatimonadaceae bacterium]